MFYCWTAQEISDTNDDVKLYQQSLVMIQGNVKPMSHVNDNLFMLSWDQKPFFKCCIDIFHRWTYESLSNNWREKHNINLDFLDGDQGPKPKSSP